MNAKKKRAAQVAVAKKAAALKAVADKKKPQSPWLRQAALTAPAQIKTSFPEQIGTAHQSQVPPRLMSKAEVLKIAHASYPTVWAWMRGGAFPRSRIVGGKSMWLSNEVDQWLAALPLRQLKGDAGQ